MFRSKHYLTDEKEPRVTADMSVIEVEAVLKKKVSSNGRELQLVSTTISEQISASVRILILISMFAYQGLEVKCHVQWRKKLKHQIFPNVPEEISLQAFQNYDTNQSLSVTKSEFRRVLETYCDHLTPQRYEGILAKVLCVSCGSLCFMMQQGDLCMTLM